MSGRLAAHAGLLSLIALAALGCASTRFKQNPGEHDHGFRYYRPKPYLLLQPPPGTENPKLVKMDLQWLPDFSEQYSVHIRPGIGTNHTTIEFDQGWNVKSINSVLDSKASEFLGAIADLLKTSPKLLTSLPGGGDGAEQRMTATHKSVTVCAHDVPLGFYESVIGLGPDGRKRLHGWRYVGFAPFASCPIDAQGGEGMSCENADLYGLVNIEGELWFRKLADLQQSPVGVTVSKRK